MAARIKIDLQEVTRLASLGLTQQQIAAALGISERTVESRKAENADFAAAIKAGQALGISEIANALWENAKGGNVTAQIFFLKARAKWKDRHEESSEEADEAQPTSVNVAVTDASKTNA